MSNKATYHNPLVLAEFNLGGLGGLHCCSLGLLRSLTVFMYPCHSLKLQAPKKFVSPLAFLPSSCPVQRTSECIVLLLHLDTSTFAVEEKDQQSLQPKVGALPQVLSCCTAVAYPLFSLLLVFCIFVAVLHAIFSLWRD